MHIDAIMKYIISACLVSGMVGLAGCDGLTNVSSQGTTADVTAKEGSPSTVHGTSTVSDGTVVITPDDDRWYFSNDHYDEDGNLVAETSGTGGIAEVPVVGDWGSYGFELTIPDGQKARAMTDLYNGVSLSDLEEVSYSTYIESAWLDGYGPSINVMIDPEGSDDFVTLVWEANKAGFDILEDTWQRWTTSAGSGGWWTPSIPFGSSTPGSNANPTQLDVLTDHFGSDSEIIGFAVNVGRHGEMTSFIDGVSITAEGSTTTYDFELFRVPSSKDECEKGGWMDVRREDASEFRNQGDCIQYVNTGR